MHICMYQVCMYVSCMNDVSGMYTSCTKTLDQQNMKHAQSLTYARAGMSTREQSVHARQNANQEQKLYTYKVTGTKTRLHGMT